MPHRIQCGRARCSRSSSRDGRRCATSTTRGDQDTAAFGRVLPRDARRRASTCRRARSRRGSSPRRTTTRAVERVVAALPALPGPPPGGRRDACLSTQPGLRQSAHDVVPRGRCPGPGDPQRTVVHLLRHGEVHNPHGVLYGRCRATTSPSSAAGWPTAPPSTSATTTSPTWSPPARARPGDGRAARRRPRPRGHPRRPGDRGRERLRGPAGRRRRRHPQAPAALPEDAQPVPAVVGRALRRVVERMRRGDRRRPHGRPRATRPSSSATSCRSG